MIKKELITFLLLLISSQVYTQNCAPSLQNDKLQTGKVSIMQEHTLSYWPTVQLATNAIQQQLVKIWQLHLFN